MQLQRHFPGPHRSHHHQPNWSSCPTRGSDRRSVSMRDASPRGSAGSSAHEPTGPRAHEPWGAGFAHFEGRASITHASCAPYRLLASAATSKRKSPRYATLQISSPRLSALDVSPRTRGPAGIIPYCDLMNFDATFSTPQRLTPVSRTVLEQAGFETGSAYGDNLSATPRSPLRSLHGRPATGYAGLQSRSQTAALHGIGAPAFHDDDACKSFEHVVCCQQ